MKSIISLAYLLLIFAILVSSCKKKKEATEPEPEPVQTPAPATPTPTALPTFIKTDSSDSHITITKISQNLGSAIDHKCDLDGDGVVDIHLIPTNLKFFGGGIVAEQSLKIETLNKDTYILTDSIYPRVTSNCTATPSQTDVNKLYPQGLTFGEQVNIIDKKWRQGNFTLYFFSEDPDTFYCHNKWLESYWYFNYYGMARYIPIKCKGRLGWYKIAIWTWNYFKLYEYALYKP